MCFIELMLRLMNTTFACPQKKRHVETPSVEVDVCSSGRRASQPALYSTEVPAVEPSRVPARLRVTPEMVAVPKVPQPELAAVHSRPTRIKKPIERYGVDEQVNVAEEVIACALCAAELEEPKTFREARKRPDAGKWLAAAQEEMDSLIEHETWSLTESNSKDSELALDLYECAISK